MQQQRKCFIASRLRSLTLAIPTESAQQVDLFALKLLLGVQSCTQMHEIHWFNLYADVTNINNALSKFPGQPQ